MEIHKEDIIRLQSEVMAFQIQTRLLEEFIAMTHAGVEADVLKKALQKSVDVTVDLTESEKGSLFILDTDGAVSDSILARGDASRSESKKIIGTVLNKGLAGWVREHRRAGLITDTESDDRWITLPGQPYLARSVLAVPIIRGQDLFGILTLQHSEPDHFSQKVADLIQMTANQMGLALENVKLYQRLDEAKKAIEEYSHALDAEFEKGRLIQRGFLPGHIPHFSDWEIRTHFLPAIQVAGDFYDVFKLPGNCLGLVIADVCDKGVGSALFMALFRSCIRIFSGQTQFPGFSIETSDLGTEGKSVDPGQALQAISLTNTYLYQNHEQLGMFATIFFGVLNPVTGALHYINAGHEPLFIVKNSEIRHYLKPTGPAVGAIPDAAFRIEEISLEREDILIGYTDGVSEAVSPDGELFTKQRLKRIIEQNSSDAPVLMKEIKSALAQFTGHTPQGDDITILIAKWNR
jgi:serine phosphatase RsbU (regulator of sigma subunit)